MCAPSLDQHKDLTSLSWPLIFISNPPSLDHTQITLSSPALENVSPFGEYLTAQTSPWPVSMGGLICRPVSGFQRRMVPSCDPLAISWALGDQSMHRTGPLCPSHGSPTTLAFLMFQSCSLPSSIPLTTIDSSGDIAMEPTAFPSLFQGFPTGSPSLVH